MKANWIPCGLALLLWLCGCKSHPPQQASAEGAVHIGDCLVVQFDIDNGQGRYTKSQMIDQNGNIVLPEAGEVHVAGMKLGEVKLAIERALFSPAIFHHVKISVSKCK